MASIVPGLEGQGRSEGHVLNVSVQFILEQVQERRRLVEQIEARGGVVSDEMKAYATPTFACYSPFRAKLNEVIQMFARYPLDSHI